MNRRAKISAICSRFQSLRFKKGVGSCSLQLAEVGDELES
jgi:hypothetical protein